MKGEALRNIPIRWFYLVIINYGLTCFQCALLSFFQAEDGIRDKLVTGVQTCALPISASDGVAVSFTPDAAVETSDRLLNGDRKSVVEGKSVDLGGRRIIKKTKNSYGGAVMGWRRSGRAHVASGHPARS